VHQFALLAGYGAEAVHPYLALESLEQLHEYVPQVTPEESAKRFVKAICKGLYKVMSKMGISTYQSYCGAQIFEAVGLATPFVEKYFTGTPTAVDGIGLKEVAEETVRMHRMAYSDAPLYRDQLDPGGEYAYRVRGEAHMWTPAPSLAAARRARQELRDVQGVPLLVNTRRGILLRGPLRNFASPPAVRRVVRATASVALYGRYEPGLDLDRGAHHARHCDEPHRGVNSPPPAKAQRLARRAERAQGADASRGSGRVATLRREGRHGSCLQASSVPRRANNSSPTAGQSRARSRAKVGSRPATVSNTSAKHLRRRGLISPPRTTTSIDRGSGAVIHTHEREPTGVGERRSCPRSAWVRWPRARIRRPTTSPSPDMTAAPARPRIVDGTPARHGSSDCRDAADAGAQSPARRTAVQVDGQMKTGRDVGIGAARADEFGFATAPLVAEGCIMMRSAISIRPVGVATGPELRNSLANPEHVINFMFLSPRRRS
jgi:glutamate synthase (NADPH/NADH) large chain